MRRLRDTLRRREVWVSRDEKITIEKALYNTLQKKNPPRWTEEEVLKCLPHENFISIIIKILLKTNFDRKTPPPVPPRSVSSPPSERQSTPPRFPKFFQSPEFPSVFNRQLYSRLPPFPSYRRSPISPLIPPRAFHLPPPNQLEKQSDGQPDEQSDGQSDGQSGGQSENQSVGRQSSLIIENPEHSSIIGNSEHVPTTENSEHPDGPSDRPSVRPLDEPAIGSSYGPLVGQSSFKPPSSENQGRPVERSDGPSISSSRPSASLISFIQSGRQPTGQSTGQSTGQPTGQSMRRLMGQLIRRSMNQPISDIHVRCGIG